MEGVRNVVSEVVNWGKVTEKLSEAGTHYYSNNGVPDKKANNGMLGNDTLLPGNT